MSAMNRLVLWTILLLLGLALAVVDFFTGWTIHFSPAALVVTLGLFGGSVGLFIAMLIAVIRDRRWIVAHSSDARWVLGRASRGVRWGSLFAIGFSLLLFANCTSNITPSPSAQVSNALQDPARFWALTAGVLTPLMLALTVNFFANKTGSLTSGIADSSTTSPILAPTSLSLGSTILI